MWLVYILTSTIEIVGSKRSVFPSQVSVLVKGLSDEKKQAVHKIGFGGFLFIHSISMPVSIVKWAVNNFNQCTCELKLEGRTWAVIGLDVAVVLGLPCTGPSPIECPKRKICGGTPRFEKANSMYEELQRMRVGP